MSRQRMWPFYSRANDFFRPRQTFWPGFP